MKRISGSIFCIERSYKPSEPVFTSDCSFAIIAGLRSIGDVAVCLLAVFLFFVECNNEKRTKTNAVMARTRTITYRQTQPFFLHDIITVKFCTIKRHYAQNFFQKVIINDNSQHVFWLKICH